MQPGNEGGNELFVGKFKDAEETGEGEAKMDERV